MSEWKDISSAPQDGTPVDLWIVGGTDDVDFYAPSATKIKGKPLRHGRAADFRWEHRAPNPPNWYPVGGLGYPLSPNVKPTHFKLLPPPPGSET